MRALKRWWKNYRKRDRLSVIVDLESGSLDNTPILINSEEDYINHFGSPQNSSEYIKLFEMLTRPQQPWNIPDEPVISEGCQLHLEDLLKIVKEMPKKDHTNLITI